MELLFVIITFCAFFLFIIYLNSLEQIAVFQEELNLLQIEKASILAKISEKPEIVQTDTNTILYGILAIGIVAVAVYFLYYLSIQSPFEAIIDHNISQTNAILDTTKATGSVIEKLNVDLNVLTSEKLVNLSDQLIAISSRIDALESAINLRHISSTEGVVEITKTFLVILNEFYKSI